MAGSEAILDRVLAFQQPVHRRVEIILVRALHSQLARERGLLETVPSFEPGQITLPRIIAMHRSRSRHAERSSNLGSSSRRAIANAAFTCPARRGRIAEADCDRVP